MTAPTGYGSFIWLPQYCEKGEVSAVVDRARRSGLSWVALHNFCAAPYVKALKDAGLWVGYSSYSLPGDAETKAFVARAKNAIQDGVDGILVDAELEWEKKDGALALRSSEARAFAESLRETVGAETFIGDAGAWAEPKFHPTYPDAAFGAVFDAAMPERYWTEFGPDVTFSRSIAESEWEWKKTGDLYKAVIPIGSCYGTNTVPPGGHQPLTPKDLEAFLVRYPTLGLWSWMHTPLWVWNTLSLLAFTPHDQIGALLNGGDPDAPTTS